IALGYFGYMANRTALDAPLNYDQFIDSQGRAQAVNSNSTKSTGFGQNVGLDWRLGNKGSPTLAVAVKNLGGARFHGATGTTTDKQDVNVGFALEPTLGKWGVLNLVLQADKLSDQDTALIKKYKVGTELLVGGYGSYATLALRGGYNYAGPSGGLYLNLGQVA